MFAIRLSEDNLPLILQTPDLTVADAQKLSELLHLEIYFIRNYVTARGVQMGWSFMPKNVMQDSFVYDPEKIQHDWDLIIRKK